MKQIQSRFRGACLACAVGILRAQAGPTLLTEDPGTPGSGRWEINVGLQHEQRPGERLSAAPILDFNYGLGSRVQLKYEVAWLWSRPADAPRHNGVSNSLAGVKWRFGEGEEATWAVSVFPQLEFRPSGSRSTRSGLVPDENTLLFPVQWRQAVMGVDLLVEVGRALPSKSSAGWYGGIALLRTLPNGVELACELNAQADHRLHRSDLVANLAALVPLGERVGLLLTFGRELHHHAAPRATVLAYVGLQLSL
ncbi:MAG: hypothetical protein ACREH8_03290 [Opitutaceae bacterium]